MTAPGLTSAWSLIVRLVQGSTIHFIFPYSMG